MSRKSLTPIVLPADPAAAMEASTKQYVDAQVALASGGAVVPAGVVQMYAGTSAPTGWLVCQGQAVSRTTYAALFAVIGTTWGTGDGSTTFNLPDTQRRFPWGVTPGSAVVLGYSDQVASPFNRTPQHDHGGSAGGTGSGHTHTFDINSVSNAPTTGSSVKITAVGGSTTTGTTTATGASHTHNIGPALQTGSSDGTTAMPNIAFNFIIKT